MTGRRVALITGGGTGIGRATAVGLSADGWAVMVVGRRPGPLDTTVRRILGKRGKAVAYSADVTEPSAARSAVEACVNEWGRLDALVNNAGVFHEGSVLESSLQEWRASFAVNVDGAFLMSRAAIPHLKRRRGEASVIVNVSSTLASRGMPGAAAYCASKGALENLTRAMALDHAPDRIRVVAVAPGIVETPMGLRGDRRTDPKLRAELAALHPWGRMGKPADVAATIVHLCRPESDWITGSVVTVDGGLTAKG